MRTFLYFSFLLSLFAASRVEAIPYVKPMTYPPKPYFVQGQSRTIFLPHPLNRSRQFGRHTMSIDPPHVTPYPHHK